MNIATTIVAFYIPVTTMCVLYFQVCVIHNFVVDHFRSIAELSDGQKCCNLSTISKMNLSACVLTSSKLAGLGTIIEIYVENFFRGQVNSIMKKLVGDNPEKDFQVLNKVELEIFKSSSN